MCLIRFVLIVGPPTVESPGKWPRQQRPRHKPPRPYKVHHSRQWWTSPSSSPSSSNAQNVDWSKLLNKPPLFDYKSSEDEIRAYRDWNWQLVQFLNAIDSGYEKELQSLMDDPSHPFDLGTASAEARNRSAKLYGLLASLCRNRSLHVVRSVKNGDGYEALRQLTLALRPSSSGRGLALMSALTSWPQFAMNQQLQPQLLRLEDALEAKQVPRYLTSSSRRSC